MLSSSFDISEFIRKVEGRCDQEIIYLADKEATAAERYIYKRQKCMQKNNGTLDCADAGHYALLLKDIVLYLRYGVQTRSVRELDLCLPELDGRPC